MYHVSAICHPQKPNHVSALIKHTDTRCLFASLLSRTELQKIKLFSYATHRHGFDLEI